MKPYLLAVHILGASALFVAGSRPSGLETGESASPGLVSPPEALTCPGPAAPAASLVPSYPPCIDLDLKATSVTGRPPLTFTWTLSNRAILPGNPARFNTRKLPAGSYTATLEVKNRFGTATARLPFVVESLRFAAPLAYENLGGRLVRFKAVTQGATELQWVWGDGTTSRWFSYCDGIAPTHRYPKGGTYTVRARARNCREPYRESAPLAITVTAEIQPQILAFQAQGCTLGFCIFPPGTPIRFEERFAGAPGAYLYDWDGNGTFEQVAATPVLTHAYLRPGIYTPVLRVTSGPLAATLRHPSPIVVSPQG